MARKKSSDQESQEPDTTNPEPGAASPEPEGPASATESATTSPRGESEQDSPGRFTIVDRESGKVVTFTDNANDAYRYRCPPLCNTLRVIVTATGKDYDGTNGGAQ